MSEAIPNPQEFKALLARLWKETEAITLGRITVIEDASSSLMCGALTPDLRARAASEAHKLAGSLGAFGFSEESRLSRTIEQMLKAESDLDQDRGSQIAQLLRQLRCELEKAPRKYWASGTKDGSQE
jgi:HPt (histidine-containing phosphotransfer) domain-containing protein